jgi:hypothetical protein
LERGRDLPAEAALFARILADYRPILAGRRLLILESSRWGINPQPFAKIFRTELAKIGWLKYRILETSSLLAESDYYFLDDHLRPKGHSRLADAIAREIADWKREDEP